MISDNGPSTPFDVPEQRLQAEHIDAPEIPLPVRSDFSFMGAGELSRLVQAELSTVVGQPDPDVQGDQGNPDHLRALVQPLREYVIHQRRAHAGAGRANIPLAALEELDAVVNPACDQDGPVDVLHAVSLVMDLLRKNVPLPADLKRAIAMSRRDLQAAMKKERSRREVRVGQAPPAFKFGIAAHKLRQVMENPEFENGSVFDHIGFIIDESTGLVTQVIIPPPSTVMKKAPVQVSFDIGAEDDKFCMLPVDESENNNAFTLTFAQPLPPPVEGMNIHEWAGDIIHAAQEEMLAGVARLPVYPSEVRRILERNDDTTKALIKILEVMHVIFYAREQKRGMDLIGYSDDESSGELDLDYVSELSILNWFAIVRHYMKRIAVDEGNENGYRDPNGRSGTLTELSVGTVYFKSAVGEDGVIPVSGGRADLIAFELDRPAVRDLNTPAGGSSGARLGSRPISEFFTFAEMVREVGGRFGSQRNPHRRKAWRNGRVFETKTRLGRNLFSAYTEMYRFEGNRIFSDMAISIQDFKFQGGDGGGFGSFTPDTVPIKSHIEQIQRYLFFAAAQLTRAHLWVQSKGEDRAIDLDDILSFMREFDVFDRITGVLLYQFANEEIPVTVRLDEAMLMEIGGKVLAEAQEKYAQRNVYRVQQALRRIAGPRIQRLRRRSREVRPLQEALAPLCIQVLGRNYMGVNQLVAALFDIAAEHAMATGSASEVPALRENLQLDNAIQVVDEKTSIIWVGGILPDSPLSQLRIAINARGQFCIRGSEGEYARGQLVSDINSLSQALTDFDVGAINEEGFRELIRQLSQTENTVDIFNDHIWVPLSVLGCTRHRVSVFGETDVLDTDGETRDLVPGKAIICRLNLLTGQWYIDEERLGAEVNRIQGLDIVVDIFGVLRLAEILNDEDIKHGMVLCPLPFHNNTDTPAAHLLEGAIITCFGECDCKIFVPGAMGDLPAIRTHPGTRIEHYRSVSYGRRRAFTNLSEMGSIFVRHGQTASRYLETRGLNPWSSIPDSNLGDVGQFGYIPPRVGRAIAELTGIDAFRQMARDKGMKKFPLVDLIRILNQREDADSVRDLIAALESLLVSLDFISSEDDITRLSELLTLGTISELRSRGIFGLRKKTHDRIGGRLIVSTFWFMPKFNRKTQKYDYIFVRTNCHARGIFLEKQLYEGPGKWAHLRGFQRRGKKRGMKKGIQLMPTPPGFWVRDPETFFEQVRDKKTIVLCEGALNAASLSRICLEHSSVTLATNGLVHKQVIALLKFLTTDPDEDGKHGLGISAEGFQVYIAYDFDGPGAKAFEKNKKRIERAVPRLEVLPVHKILPVEMQKVLPPFDPNVFKPGQPWHGVKFDLNDVIRWERFAWKFAHQSDNLVLKEPPASIF